jgi:ABC-2 type transport system permease protein
VTALRRVLAQTRIELLLTLRRGESVLLTFLIPVVVLGFFSMVDVLPTPAGTEDPVDFLFPGVLALAVMSTAMVSLAIATGFERQLGVLKRLGATPLTRPQLLAAKTLAIAVLEVLQVAVLLVEALALGWRADSGFGAALAAMALATIAFAGLGMLMAGTLPALTTLAAANGLYIVLLLLGGMIVPLAELPAALEAVARVLPAGALSELVHAALDGRSGSPSGGSWVVLTAWAVAAPALAAWRFRWE